jgi:hypothetical protein
MTLNKHQQREVNTAIACIAVLGNDYAARCISALYRAALKDSQKRELISIGLAYGLISSNDWII